MKKYHYEKNKIIENATKYVIQVCKTADEAKKLCGKLNGGTGFQGETPNFFIYAKDQA